MPVTITAKVNGFRRCGIAHPDTATTYPDDHFTKAQLAELRAEPMLVVSFGAEPVTGADTAAEEQIAALEAEVCSLNTAAELLKDDNRNLNSIVGDLTGQTERLTAENTALQAELAALREQKDTPPAQVKQDDTPPAAGGSNSGKKSSAK
ncbi:TPA: hypothetical protein OT801_000605 [Morganella morganii]|nr:hypothetical protein [Morganella morganii]HCT7721718.1 hypothetical protein [Morganella morganii]